MPTRSNIPIVKGIWKWIHDDSLVTRATYEDPCEYLNASGVSLEAHGIIHAPHYERHDHKDDTTYPIPNLADIYNPFDEPTGWIGIGDRLSDVNDTVSIDSYGNVCISGTLDGDAVPLMYFDYAIQDSFVEFQSTLNGYLMQIGGNSPNSVYVSEQVLVGDNNDLSLTASTLVNLQGRKPIMGLLILEATSNAGLTPFSWRIGDMNIEVWNDDDNVTFYVPPYVPGDVTPSVELRFGNFENGSNAIKTLIGLTIGTDKYNGNIFEVSLTVVPLNDDGTYGTPFSAINQPLFSDKGGPIDEPIENAVGGVSNSDLGYRGLAFRIPYTILQLGMRHEFRLTFYEDDIGTKINEDPFVVCIHESGKGASTRTKATDPYEGTVCEFDLTHAYPGPTYRCYWNIELAPTIAPVLIEVVDDATIVSPNFSWFPGGVICEFIFNEDIELVSASPLSSPITVSGTIATFFTFAPGFAPGNYRSLYLGFYTDPGDLPLFTYTPTDDIFLHRRGDPSVPIMSFTNVNKNYVTDLNSVLTNSECFRAIILG